MIFYFIQNSDFRMVQSEIPILVQDSLANLLTEFSMLAALVCRGKSRSASSSLCAWVGLPLHNTGIEYP